MGAAVGRANSSVGFLYRLNITYFNPHSCLLSLGTTLSVEVPSGESVN
jgi:hypothetical protein